MHTSRPPEEWIDRRHPVDDLEPEESPHDVYREAGLKCVRVMNAAFAHIGAALARQHSTRQDILVAFWQPAYAMGLMLCDGKSVTDRAHQLGVKKATLSKGMTQFCRANNLPPSDYMKDALASKSYKNARKESVKKHGIN